MMVTVEVPLAQSSRRRRRRLQLLHRARTAMTSKLGRSRPQPVDVELRLQPAAVECLRVAAALVAAGRRQPSIGRRRRRRRHGQRVPVADQHGAHHFRLRRLGERVDSATEFARLVGAGRVGVVDRLMGRPAVRVVVGRRRVSRVDGDIGEDGLTRRRRGRVRSDDRRLMTTMRLDVLA